MVHKSFMIDEELRSQWAVSLVRPLIYIIQAMAWDQVVDRACKDLYRQRVPTGHLDPGRLAHKCQQCQGEPKQALPISHGAANP